MDISQSGLESYGNDENDEELMLLKQSLQDNGPAATLQSNVSLLRLCRVLLLHAPRHSPLDPHLVPFLLKSLTGPSDSDTHQGARLSLTVSALALMLETESPVLALESNTLQMLRLFLSRGVYPTETTASRCPDSGCPTPTQEAKLCRLGLTRLLSLSPVDRSELVRTEIISFLRKWWHRLALSSEGVLSASSSSPKYRVPGTTAEELPTLRVVLELMASIVDIRRSLPWLAASLKSLARELPPAFLQVFLRCADYKTVFATARVLSAFALMELGDTPRERPLAAEACAWMRVVLDATVETVAKVVASTGTGTGMGGASLPRKIYLGVEPLLYGLIRLLYHCFVGLTHRSSMPLLTSSNSTLTSACKGVLSLFMAEAAATIGTSEENQEASRSSSLSSKLQLLRRGVAFALGACSIVGVEPLHVLEGAIVPHEAFEAARGALLQGYNYNDDEDEDGVDDDESDDLVRKLLFLLRLHESSFTRGEASPTSSSTRDCTTSVIMMQQSPNSTDQDQGEEGQGEGQGEGEGEEELFRSPQPYRGKQLVRGTFQVQSQQQAAECDGAWSYSFDSPDERRTHHSRHDNRDDSISSLCQGQVMDSTARKFARDTDTRRETTLGLDQPPAAAETANSTNTDTVGGLSSTWPRRALEAEKAAHFQACLLKREQQLRAEQATVLGEAWDKMSVLAEAEAAATIAAASAAEWAEACQNNLLREQERNASLEQELHQVQTRAHSAKEASARTETSLRRQIEELRSKLGHVEARFAEKTASLHRQVQELNEQTAAQAHALGLAKEQSQREAQAHAKAVDNLTSALHAEQAAHRKTSDELRVEMDKERLRADAHAAELANHRQLLSFIHRATTVSAAGTGTGAECVTEFPGDGKTLQQIRRMSIALSQSDKENR